MGDRMLEEPTKTSKKQKKLSKDHHFDYCSWFENFESWAFDKN
jgi:hypothetical protein